MTIRVVNLIRDVDPRRMGIVRSATDMAPALRDEGVETELWYPGAGPAVEPQAVHCRRLSGTTGPILREMIRTAHLDPANTVVVTHGPWGYQTSWGNAMKRLGYAWVYVPHGALEPWALRHKGFKKWIYFRVRERVRAARSDAIRALSEAERRSLLALFPGHRVELIRNGVALPSAPASGDPNGLADATRTGSDDGHRRRFLFLGRLHEKKGPVRLADAWLASSCNDDPECELVVAGPDEGELGALESRIARSTNIRYVGPVYGEAKEALFARSTFYVLPSLSEGLPVSVLEAAAGGLVPLITEGCNVPELLVPDGALRIGADADGVRAGIETVRAWTGEVVARRAATVKAVIERDFDLSAVARAHKALFRSLLEGGGKRRPSQAISRQGPP